MQTHKDVGFQLQTTIFTNKTMTMKEKKILIKLIGSFKSAYQTSRISSMSELLFVLFSVESRIEFLTQISKYLIQYGANITRLRPTMPQCNF